MKSKWTPEQLEREYSPSSCIGGNYQPHIEQYRLRSAVAKDLAHVSTSAYDLFVPPLRSRGDVSAADRGVLQGFGRDTTPLSLCDISPTAVGANKDFPPLLVFIHGGYWQELSKADSLFAAPDCVNAGIAFAAIEYTLAPKASVAQIVQECCAAVADLRARAKELGFDANRIYVAGSSAGAHLAAMVARVVPVAGVILVSGIYDLTPLVGTSINEALSLDAASALASSPAHLAGQVSQGMQAIVCWGEIETAEFKRQSNDYADLLTAQGAHHGGGVQRFEVPTKNHFDIILDLANPASQLGQATHALLQTAHAAHR